MLRRKENNFLGNFNFIENKMIQIVEVSSSLYPYLTFSIESIILTVKHFNGFPAIFTGTIDEYSINETRRMSRFQLKMMGFNGLVRTNEEKNMQSINLHSSCYFIGLQFLKTNARKEKKNSNFQMKRQSAHSFFQKINKK